MDKYHHKYKELVEKLTRTNHHTKYFCGRGNTLMIICKNDEIVVQTII